MMFTNLSIRVKIVLGQVILIAMVAVFIYNYYPQQQEKAALLAIESKIKSISDMFSIGVGIGMGETDLVAVSEALEWAYADSAVVYISVVNLQNQKIASFQAPGIIIPPAVSGIAIQNKLVDIQQTIYYKTNIVYQNEPFGRLVIGYSLLQMRKMIRDLKVTTLYFCIALFVSGGILSFITSNMITGGIRKLTSTVD